MYYQWQQISFALCSWQPAVRPRKSLETSLPASPACQYAGILSYMEATRQHFTGKSGHVMMTAAWYCTSVFLLTYFCTTKLEARHKSLWQSTKSGHV